MNVSCEKCQKRYSIADDRVRGKAIKIRCKHCQAIMVVKGPPHEDKAPPEEKTTAMQVDRAALFAMTAAVPAPVLGGGEEEKTRVAPALDPSIVWFAMVKGKQEGPFDPRALHTLVKAGDVTLRTYVWNQGMKDWKRARDVAELATLFAGVDPSAAPGPPVASPPVPAPVHPKVHGRLGVATPLEAQTDPGEDPRNAEASPDMTDPGADEEPSGPGVVDGALSATQAPSPEVVGQKAGYDPLGELFSDNPTADDGPQYQSQPNRVIEEVQKKKNGKAAVADPFDSLGDIDPAMLPPPGEATRFYIEQAGVNKRNPPWKIASFVVGGLVLPVAVLYALSMMHIVPLEVTRVDEQGHEVTESLFSTGGVSGLKDLLTGKNKKKKAVAPPPPVRQVPTVKAPVPLPDKPPVVDPKAPVKHVPTKEELAALYGDSTRQEIGPKVRSCTEVTAKDNSTGGLSEEATSKVVAQSMPAFQQCIENELRKNPNLKLGKAEVTVTVGGSGVVKRAEIDKKDVDLSPLGECLKSRAKRMAFPAFGADEEAEVHIPLILGATM